MNNYLTNVAGRNLSIVSLRIADTGTYDDQWSRPYESVIGADFVGIVNSLQEQGISNGRSITPGMFSNIAGDIIRPQAQPESSSPIVVPNGWGTNRLRWTMLVKVSSDFHEFYQLITGYTDVRGIGYTSNATLDPQMVFTIGNVIMLQQSMRPSAAGNRTVYNVSEASHILAHNESSGMNLGNQKFRMRPTDVFNAMDTTHIAEDLYSNGGMDTRTLVTGEAVKANRAAEIPTNYVAGIMDSYNRAQQLDKYGQNDGQIWEAAIDNSRDPVMAKDAFIRAMAQMRGTVSTNFFTWRDLCELDPNVQRDEVTKVTYMGSPRQYVNDSMAARGNFVNWSGNTIHTQIAVTLAQAIPAIMMSLGFASMRFYATNRTVNKQFVVNVAGYKDFASSLSTVSLDMSEQIALFQSRVGSEVMLNVSQGSMLDMEVEMEVNIVGETFIKIMAGMDPTAYEYAVPSFMDAAFTPLMTGNQQRTVDIARDMQNLMGQTLGSSQSPNYLHDQSGQPISQPLSFNMNQGGVGMGGMGNVNPSDLI